MTSTDFLKTEFWISPNNGQSLTSRLLNCNFSSHSSNHHVSVINYSTVAFTEAGIKFNHLGRDRRVFVKKPGQESCSWSQTHVDAGCGCEERGRAFTRLPKAKKKTKQRRRVHLMSLNDSNSFWLTKVSWAVSVNFTQPVYVLFPLFSTVLSLLLSFSYSS